MSDEPQYLYLTTIGWKTGNPHRIEIWFVQYDERYYVVSEYPKRAHWVQNIRHDQSVKFTVGSHSFEGKGRLIDSAKEGSLAETISALMDQKYGWSNGQIVELKPEKTSG